MRNVFYICTSTTATYLGDVVVPRPHCRGVFALATSNMPMYMFIHLYNVYIMLIILVLLVHTFAGTANGIHVTKISDEISVAMFMFIKCCIMYTHTTVIYLDKGAVRPN